MVFSTNYVIVLIVQLLTNLAFSFYTMGVTYFVYTTTHSVFYSSLITFLSLFSRILSGLSINIVSSLIKIKKLLIFTTFLQIIFTIIIFFLIHFESLILLYVFIALLSYTTGFFNPIKSLLLKKILDKEIMTKGLSIISSLDQTLSLLGWIAGGWLISIVGYKNIIIITIIFITISLIVVSNLKIEDYKQILDSRNPFKALNTSMKNLKLFPKVYTLIKIECIEVFVGSIWIGSVTLAFVNDFLNMTSEWWGYINAAYYIGSILGSLLVIKYSNKFNKNPLYTILVSMILYGIILIIYGNINISIISLILVVIIGPILQTKDITQESYIINIVPEEQLLEFSALKSSIIQFCFMISIILVGGLGEIIPINYVYTISGIVTLLTAFYFKKFTDKYYENQ